MEQSITKLTRSELLSERDCKASTCSDFLRSAAYAIVQRPIDAAAQMRSQPGNSEPKLALIEKPKHENLSTAIGSVTGTLLQFCLINKTFGKLTGLGQTSTALASWKGETVKLGLTGLTTEFFTPVDKDKPFLSAKIGQMTSGFLSCAAFGGITGKANERGLFGRAGNRTLGGNAFVFGTAGGASGFLSTEIKSLAEKRELASFADVSKGIGSGAAFGIAFGALDQFLTLKRPLELKSDQPLPKGMMSTESWVSRPDAKLESTSSRIFSWIAENRPHLRPSSYNKFRNEGHQEFLSLADWPADQRPAVVAELRKLANTEFSTDSNLDAFVSSMSRPLNRVAAIENHQRLQTQMEMELENQLKTVTSEEKLDKYVELSKRINAHSLEDPYSPELQQIFNDLTAQTGMPPLKVRAFNEDRGSMGSGGEMHIGVDPTPEGMLSAKTIEIGAHEFHHHVQGWLSSWETFSYMARYPIYQAAQKLGIVKDLPIFRGYLYEESTTQLDILNKYVGASTEKDAFSVGMLARLRALQSGVSPGT